MSKKKISVITLIVLVLSFLTMKIVVAQEEIPVEEIGIGETQEISDPALKLQMKVNSAQDYPSKKFSVSLFITAEIDSDRVSVDWTFPGAYFTAEGPLKDIVSVRSGQTVEVKKFLTPKQQSSATNANKKVEFGSRVNAFIDDVNYLSATSTTADFNSELELIPIYAAYQTDKVVANVVKYGVILIIVVAIVIAIFVAVSRFRSYLNSPD